MLVRLIPPIVLGPFIVPFIDRWNRKKIIIISDLSIAVVTAGLVILFLTDAIQIWHIYVALIATALGGTFHRPAVIASVPMIVPKEHLSRANGLNQMLGGIINIVSPPVGAFLIETLPMHIVLSVDILTAIIAVGCLLAIHIPQPVRITLAVKSNVLGDMMQGFRYIWSWRGLMILAIQASIVNLFLVPLFSLIPIFVTRHLGGEVLRLGWLEMALGVGIIAGGLLLGVWGGFKRRIITCLTAVSIGGIAGLVFGFTTIELFGVGIAAWFLQGAVLAVANGAIGAIFQSFIARDMQGRFFSTVGSISAAMTPIGLAIAGPVADAIGIRTVIYIAGTAILIVIMPGFFIRDLMNIEKNPTEVQSVEETE